MSQTKNVVCPGCSLLCDDLTINANGSAIVANNACHRGQAFFDLLPTEPPTHFVASEPSDLNYAIGAAAEILNQSQAPLICGLDQMTTQAQQVAWKIADQIGATIDTTLTNHGRASMFALQRVGKVTASFGEVAHRSDLIVFWFCDPEITHPRLMERLSRSDSPARRIIVIDEVETATAKKADQFQKVNPDQAAALLAVLRATVQGHTLDARRVLETTGIAPGMILDLAKCLQSAKYGSFLLGQINPDSSFELATDFLSSLIRELNNVTRFVGIKLRTDINAQSAEDVLSWSSGYPMAISQSQGFPRFNWLEHSAETVLQRRECDAVLFATGTDWQQTLAGLSRTSHEYLTSISTIVLSPIANTPSSVAIQVGQPGLNASGEFCRFDGVSLPLTKQAKSESEFVDAADVLRMLQKKIQ